MASRRTTSSIVFSRPIRWILALHDGFVVPFYYAGISSGNQSCGLRNPSLANFKVETAESYLRAVEKAGILIIRRSGRKKSCMPLVYWLKVSVAISLRLIACCRRLSILWRRPSLVYLVLLLLPMVQLARKLSAKGMKLFSGQGMRTPNSFIRWIH
ncbi:uncharacterized protein [Miscanthus floridulus]|uniref:uncharacterized protein n=1 Tax=Miscanthus floridulus TaxID=154761 RepID=UPI00345A8675